MSCNGCRVLRKRCDPDCVLRPCLESIQSPDAQGHATLFLSKFFGRSDLLSFISAAPSGPQRSALFQSLLYEAAGRTVNPVSGAMGLLSTGNWDLCEAAVQTVLAGGSPESHADRIIPEVEESSNGFVQSRGVLPITVMTADGGGDNFPLMQRRCNDGEEPKLLNLFV